MSRILRTIKVDPQSGSVIILIDEICNVDTAQSCLRVKILIFVCLDPPAYLRCHFGHYSRAELFQLRLSSHLDSELFGTEPVDLSMWPSEISFRLHSSDVAN